MPKRDAKPKHKAGLDDIVQTKGKATLLEMTEQAEKCRFLAQENRDAGNADRLILYGEGNIRYLPAFKRWVVYDGARWPVDDREQEHIRDVAKSMIRAFGAEAFKSNSKETRAFASQSLESQRISNMLREAQHLAILKTGELDRDPLLVNFRNGTFDARTQKLHSHRREDYLTAVVPYDYDPTAKCPKFERFVAETFGGDRQLIAFVQRALGYSLTGDTSEKCMFLAYGPTNTGKTTLLTIVRMLLDKYATQIKATSLMAQHGRPMDSNGEADLADLRGKRAVTTSETAEGQRVREELIKALVQGQGEFKAVRKYENPFSFPETWKIWMDSNHLPVIHGTDDAIWSRIVVIPFTHAIPKARQDKKLSRKLIKEEASGILTWLIQGLCDWQTKGSLGPLPSVMEKLRQEWRNDSDVLGRWLAEKCVKDTEAKTPSQDLYRSYKVWRASGNFLEESIEVFARKMKDRGFKKQDFNVTNKKTKKRVKIFYWMGIELNSGEKQKFE